MIKFLDIFKQDQKIHSLIIKDIKRLFKSGDFILGKGVLEFENNFKDFTESKYAISCGNGTDALTIALKSLNLPNNSEVIIPAMTYASTAFAVINANLKPVLVDIAPLSSTIDIRELKKKISKKTKVIMPVHLYGSVTNLTSIKKIIQNRNIYLIDDCAQAHGAYDDSQKTIPKKIGSSTDISCFSLYPGKNLGAYGDAGIITTNSKKFFKRIRLIRNLGSEEKFIHKKVGINSRLDTIQAIILNKKIKSLNSLNKKRKTIAKIYHKEIKNNKLEKLIYSKGCVYHQYVILTKFRKKLINLFKKNRIQYGFHYPFAIHQLKVFKKRFVRNKFKNSEKIARQGISLPIDPNLKKSEIIKICKVINSL
mgnify:CR=1 FL=1